MARLVVIVAACAGALYLLYLTRGVLKLLAIALFTATALGPVVDAVQRLRVPRAWAILLQVRQLSHDAERGIVDVRRNATVRRYDNRYHISEKIQAQLRSLPGRLYRRVVQVAPITTIVAVLVVGTVLGLLGALLAIPAAAAIQLIVQDLRAGRRRLGVDAA